MAATTRRLAVRKQVDSAKVLALTLLGYSQSDIALALKVSREKIQAVTNTPEYQAAVVAATQQVVNEAVARFTSLFDLAYTEIKNVLENGSDSNKMRAAKLVLDIYARLPKNEAAAAAAIAPVKAVEIDLSSLTDDELRQMYADMFR
jgi:glycine cleavage system regulatory protein